MSEPAPQAVYALAWMTAVLCPPPVEEENEENK